MFKIIRCRQHSALLSRVIIKFGDFKTLSTQFPEQKVELGKHLINYVRVGEGEHSLLCFPGALGSVWTDFKPQIKDLDKSKFTIVAWDPPGYGKSRPPNRIYPKGFYEKDANTAYKFMKAIGIKKYSLLGWSDGGISSMILAAKYPECVNKLVIWGASAYITPDEIKTYENLKNIDKWSDKMKAPLIKLYGDDVLQEMWNGWCEALELIHEEGGNICKDLLPQIRCPTLILHGNEDPMVAPEHPKHLKSKIKGAKLHRFPEGKHNIHLRYADEFNAVVTRFLED